MNPNTTGEALMQFPLPAGMTGADGEEWRRQLQGLCALAELAEGRRGEEGMRRHYLALMERCTAYMGELMRAGSGAA